MPGPSSAQIAGEIVAFKAALEAVGPGVAVGPLPRTAGPDTATAGTVLPAAATTVPQSTQDA